MKENNILDLESLIKKQKATQALKYIVQGQLKSLTSPRLKERMTVQNISNKGARSILNEAANTWNKIPMNIKESKTLIEFKKNKKNIF